MIFRSNVYIHNKQNSENETDSTTKLNKQTLFMSGVKEKKA